MKNSMGNVLILTLFGESHGPYIGAVLDGLAPGMPVDEAFIRDQLALRRPYGKISTSRVEADEFVLASGVFNGKTTGTPLTILIPNTQQQSRDYEENRFLPRPSHADYTAYVKYRGFEDYRGGGHFSGRLTAALAAAGAVVLPALKEKGIIIGTHIRTLGKRKDVPFSEDPEILAGQIQRVNEQRFAVLDADAADGMIKDIEEAAANKDSIGGTLETAIAGMPAGIGEPWFDTLEGEIAKWVFSIPGIKGVEFGNAFSLTEKTGSEYNDAFSITEDGEIITKTNHNAGINGGISNGMPIIFRTAVKPTPSIFRPQETVDLKRGENTVLTLSGRHDPAIIHRVRVVQDSVTALAMADLLSMHYGTDYLGK